MDASPTESWQDLKNLALADKGAEWSLLVRSIKDIIFIESAKGGKSKQQRNRKQKRKKKKTRTRKKTRKRKEEGNDSAQNNHSEEEWERHTTATATAGPGAMMRRMIVCNDCFEMSV